MSRYITIDTPPTALDSNGLPYQRADAPLAAFGGNDANSPAQFSGALNHNVANYRDQLRQQQQLLAHESAANDALTGFRLGAVQAGRAFTGLRMKDAVDGHDGYLQAITQSRDDAIRELPGPARALLKPHLDRAFNVARQLGQDHQMAQNHAWSDQSSLDSLDADAQEAVLHRNNPAQVQALADRAVGEWAKIGERRGWDMGRIAQQAAQSKAALFANVVQALGQDGNGAGMQQAHEQAQGQVDPDSYRKMLLAHVDLNNRGATPEQPPNPRLGQDNEVDPRVAQLAEGGKVEPVSGQPIMDDASSDTIGGAANAPQMAQVQKPTVNPLPQGKPSRKTPQPVMPNGRTGSMSQSPNQDGPDGEQSIIFKNKNTHTPSLDEARAQTGAKVRTYAINPTSDDTKSSFRTSTIITSPIPQPQRAQVERIFREENYPEQYSNGDYAKARQIIQDVSDGKIGNWDWNIANLEYDRRFNWDGSGPPLDVPKTGHKFVTFTAPEYGVKAIYKNVLANIPIIANTKSTDDIVKALPANERVNLTNLTIRNIGLHWKGPGDTLKTWVDNVSKWSGIDPNATLNPEDLNQMIALMRGMNYAEKGRQTVTDSQYRDGIVMARNRTNELPEKGEDQKQEEFLQTARQAPGAGPSYNDNKDKTINLRRLLFDEIDQNFVGGKRR